MSAVEIGLIVGLGGPTITLAGALIGAWISRRGAASAEDRRIAAARDDRIIFENLRRRHDAYAAINEALVGITMHLKPIDGAPPRPDMAGESVFVHFEQTLRTHDLWIDPSTHVAAWSVHDAAGRFARHANAQTRQQLFESIKDLGAIMRRELGLRQLDKVSLNARGQSSRPPPMVDLSGPEPRVVIK